MTVALVITARPSYSRVRTLIPALRERGVTVQVIVAGSALLYRYGSVVDLITQDCGPVERAYTVVEGETHETTAKSTGLVTMDVAAILRRLKPDAVIVHADRHEVLGAAIAARYLELPLIHLQGGEQTGSIDDRVRDAITQLADLHLVSTVTAQHRVRTMREQRAIVTGCPSIDVALEGRQGPPVTFEELGGAGATLDLSQPFLVVLQHPTSDHAGQAFDEMAGTLLAVRETGYQAIVFWPGNEAGTDGASKAIRLAARTWPIRTVRNLPPERFIRLLTHAACLVGSSSAGIRECSALGVPAVNIGTRQAGRERAQNVIDCEDYTDADDAIRWQVRHGAYPPSMLYGDGTGGVRMAEAIATWLEAR